MTIINDPEILGGKPIIEGTRISVDFVLLNLAEGATVQVIAARHDGITEEDVRDAILHAARCMRATHDA